jgi:fibronectin-binding autotransporter adhesin
MRRAAEHPMRVAVGRIVSIFPLLLLSGILLACPRAGRAQAINDTWNGGNGQWNVPGNWNNGVPNNNGTFTYNVFIDNGLGDNAMVTISGINPTISNLTLDAGNVLNLSDNQSLTIAGGSGAGSLDIAGTLNLNSVGDNTDLILSGTNATITLSGGGTLALSNFFQNRIYGTGSQTLVNSAGNTIQGSGQLGIGSGGNAFALNNAGIINANQSVALNVNPGNGTTNTGTLEATIGGTLNLAGSITNTGATILSTGAGSVVNLAGAGASTITGGTLTTANGGAMYSNNSTLSGLTISAGSTVTTSDNQTTTLTGTITNHGTIALNSGGDNTNLVLSGGAAVELTSGSSITMSGFFQNRIYGSGSDTLTVDSGATIQGSGQIGVGSGNAFTLNNAGTINSNSGTMAINAGNTVTNTNLIEATGGATLNLGGSFTNTGGTILSTGAGSVVNLAGAGASTITGGTLTTANGGAMYSNNSTLSGLTISAGSTVTTTDNQTTTLTGTITNHGTIALNSGGDNTNLVLSGAAVELTSGSSISMSGFFQNRIYGSGSDTLTVDSGATIQGGGQVGINGGSGYAFTLNNAGTINANLTGVTFQVAPTNTVTNTNVMEATNGGILTVSAPVTNTGAIIQAVGTGSLVNFSGASVTGGTLEASGGGAMAASNNSTLSGLTINGGVMTSSNSTFSNVTINSGSTIQPQDNSTTTLTGTITNHGTIALNSIGDNTNLVLSGGAAVELTSGSSITMSNFFQNRIYGTGSDTLTVDSGATIQGSGQVGLGSGGNAFALNNAGIIDANQSVALNVNPGNGTTNIGTLEATGGNTLNLGGSFANTGGTILSTGSGSVVNLAGAGASTITGGTLTTTSGGAMYSDNSTLSGLTISTGSTVTTSDNQTTTLTGIITNKGTIVLNSVGDNTNLVLSGGAAVELTSGSSISLSGLFQNRIYGSGTDTLTVDSGATIQGAGQIGVGGGNAFTLSNAGTINSNSGTMAINSGNTVTNTNLIEATNGATLNLGGSFTNTGGTILSTGAGSVVSLAGAGSSTITGGTLTTASGGVMYSNNSTLSGLTISAGSTVTTTDNQTTTLTGTITNHGTIALNSGGDNTNLVLNGNVALLGTGILAMSNFAQNRIFGNTGSEQLTNGASHTIEGSGQLGIGAGGNAFALTNNGMVIANQTNALVVNPGNGITNNGTFQVNPGSTLQVNDSFTTAGTVNIGQSNNSSASLFQMGGGNDYVQTGGTTSLWSTSSTLAAASGHAVNIEGGLLQGFGTIQGNLINAGTVHPGDGPGILTVNGSYTQSSTGLLDLQIGGTSSGSFSELVVNGSASLNGMLDVSLMNGFLPTSGDQWVILTSTSLSGTFIDSVIHDGGFTFTATYSPAGFTNDVVLTLAVASVPEPASIVMLGLGLAGIGAFVARQSRAAARS